MGENFSILCFLLTAFARQRLRYSTLFEMESTHTSRNEVDACILIRQLRGHTVDLEGAFTREGGSDGWGVATAW
jgi:hypothetical protein